MRTGTETLDLKRNLMFYGKMKEKDQKEEVEHIHLPHNL